MRTRLRLGAATAIGLGALLLATVLASPALAWHSNVIVSARCLDGQVRIHYTVEAWEKGHEATVDVSYKLDGEVKGLKAWPRAERPNALIVFWSFRIMVGIGVLMVVLGLFSLGARYRGRLYDCGALHRFAMLMGPMGFVAVLAGWITTEVGRQPYTIYGLLRTADSISPIDAQAVGFSLLAFIVVYFAVFGAGTYYILRLMGQTPDIDEPDLEKGIPVRAAGITPASALEAVRSAAGKRTGG